MRATLTILYGPNAPEAFDEGSLTVWEGNELDDTGHVREDVAE